MPASTEATKKAAGASRPETPSHLADQSIDAGTDRRAQAVENEKREREATLESAVGRSRHP